MRLAVFGLVPGPWFLAFKDDVAWHFGLQVKSFFS